ncbi:MAG: HAMP domain-containing sensor histidine kinase [Dermatophilaceae bacterium]
MNRLVVRLVLSHLLVAVLAATATFLVVRLLAPALFDESIRMSPMGQGPGGMGGQAGALRQQFGDAVDQALLVGAIVGAGAAAGFGAVAAYRLLEPLRAVRAAARDIAAGRYDTSVPAPRERELAELADDINRLGHALDETETRRVRLLGEVAHEMRTPLTVIDGHVEGMIDGVLPTSATELGLLSDEVRRLRRLAEDLSMLSRTDEGRLEIVMARVDLAQVAGRAVERMRPQAEDAGLTLTVDGAAAAPVVADADRLAQVLTNLVGNAIRATGPGGRIDVVCRASGSDALVTVADSGEGLDPADLERVFERFYRSPGHRTPGPDRGSGIGLTIARGIARAHGGEVSAASPGRGRGATFTVRVPLAR